MFCKRVQGYRADLIGNMDTGRRIGTYWRAGIDLKHYLKNVL